MIKKKKKDKYQSAQDLTATRGIVSKEEAEQYLDANSTEFPFQCWAIAMMMCYGMRNHELWHCSPLENDPNDASFKKGISLLYK